MKKSIIIFKYLIIALVISIILPFILIGISFLFKDNYNEITELIIGTISSFLTGLITSLVFAIFNLCRKDINLRSHIQSETTELFDNINYQPTMKIYYIDANNLPYIKCYRNNARNACNKIFFKKDCFKFLDELQTLTKNIEKNIDNLNKYDLKPCLDTIFNLSNNLLI